MAEIICARCGVHMGGPVAAGSVRWSVCADCQRRAGIRPPTGQPVDRPPPVKQRPRLIAWLYRLARAVRQGGASE